jgi:hypothetical protein
MLSRVTLWGPFVLCYFTMLCQWLKSSSRINNKSILWSVCLRSELLLDMFLRSLKINKNRIYNSECVGYTVDTSLFNSDMNEACSMLKWDFYLQIPSHLFVHLYQWERLSTNASGFEQICASSWLLLHITASIFSKRLIQSSSILT